MEIQEEVNENKIHNRDFSFKENEDVNLDEESKLKLQALDPNFLNDKPLTEFQKSKSYPSKGKI